MNIDLDRIAKLLGVAGSSAHDPEAVNAIRLADREIRKAGFGWVDLINPSRELAVADEANALLLAQNQALREELDLIRSHNGRGGQWDDVANSGGSVNATAQWALTLAQRGIIDLTERERDFLGTCQRWRGRLTVAQQSWFDALIAKATARTGQYPPT
jgi:hypothetical protein